MCTQKLFWPNSRERKINFPDIEGIEIKANWMSIRIVTQPMWLGIPWNRFIWVITSLCWHWCTNFVLSLFYGVSTSLCIYCKFVWLNSYLLWVVYLMQCTLDGFTYMSVEWGRSYEILAKSLEHSWITRRVHGQFAQKQRWTTKLWGCNVISKITDVQFELLVHRNILFHQ